MWVYVLQPDCLDDLAWAIMHEISKLSYRVSEDDVTRARNQVIFFYCQLLSYMELFILSYSSFYKGLMNWPHSLNKPNEEMSQKVAF